jgi:hypothetical protein
MDGFDSLMGSTACGFTVIRSTLLKTRRRVQRDQAVNEWKALIKAGWKPVEPQW